jgi:cytosol alanyl aminopeptidase
MDKRTLRMAVAASFLPVLAAACGTARPADATPAVPSARDKAPAAIEEEPGPGFRLPGDTRPVEYAIALEVDPRKGSFTGRETIRVHLDKARRTLWLDGRGLEITGARVAGREARYRQMDDDGQARLVLDAPVGPGEVDVVIAWHREFDARLEGIYKLTAEGTPYVFTQFEAISARDAIPSFDEPGFKTPFVLTLTIDPRDRAVANTPESSRTSLDDGRVQVTFARTEPLPIYLLAFAVGPFDVVDGRTLPSDGLRRAPLPIRGVAIRGKGAQLRQSLDVAAEALVAFEKWFGIPYAFGKMDIVAVPDFAAGAMENPGLVTFRDSLLFVDGGKPIRMQEANVYVIVHEFAHQWFGDLVTPAWWDDIWLNEAFASFMETPIVAELRPIFRAQTTARSNADWVMGEDSLVSARKIRQPVAAKGDILNAFDGITYTKGAAVIAMFERWMGADAFKRGVRAYLEAHAHGTATADDLLAAFTKASGRDITTPFSTFLDQPGVPYVGASLQCDLRAKTAVVKLTQQRFLPVGSTGERDRSWQIPVCVRFDEDGKARSACTLLTGTTGSLPLDTRTCPTFVHPNADALGYYRWSLPAKQLEAVASKLKLLTAGERISFANAARAAAWTAAIPLADAIEVSMRLARDEEPDIAGTPFGLLAFALDDLVEPDARPAVRKKIADAYRPVLDELTLTPGPEEDPRVRERRSLAIRALVDAAEDPKTTSLLVKLGRAVLGLDGDKKIHLDEAPADLAGLAIAAAVRSGKDAVFDDVGRRLSFETDSVVRSYYLRALGGVRDEPLASRARDLALDGRLKVNEILVPLSVQAGDFRTRDAAWAWFQRNYDALVQRLPEEFGRDRVPDLFSGYCALDKAEEIRAFFEPRKAKVPGMERAVAQLLESIRLCAAKKAAHQEGLRKLFPRTRGAV